MKMTAPSKIRATEDLSRKKFEIFQEISAAIVALDSITSISSLLLDIAASYTNAGKGSLMLMNEQGDLHILAGRDIDASFIRTYRAKLGEGIAGIVAEKREPVLVADIDKDPRFRDRRRDRYRTRSFISCPIISRKKLLGVLNINDKKDGKAFTEDEFELMKVITNQAAIVLENAFLMNELRLQAADLEESNRRLRERDAAKTDFLTRASHELRTPLNSIKGAVYYLLQSEPADPKGRRDFYGIISDETGNLIAVIESLISFIRLEDEMKVLNKTALQTADLLQEIFCSRALRDELERNGLRLELDLEGKVSDIVGDRLKITQFFTHLISGMAHYLESGDVIGVRTLENDFTEIRIDPGRKLPAAFLELLSTSRQVFDPQRPDEEVQLYLAGKIAEIHHWSLDLQDSGSSSLLCIRILKQRGQRSEAALKMTLDLFVEFFADMLDIDRCSILLPDHSTGDLTIRSSRGLSDEVISRTRIRPGDKIAGWVALEGKPLLVEDIRTDDLFRRRNVHEYTSRSFISLPLKRQERVVGVVNLNNKKNGVPFTQEDLRTASLITDRISFLVEKFTTGEYGEADFMKFMKSFSGLLEAEKRYHKKQAVITDLITGILEELGAPEDVKGIAPYISAVYDVGLMLIDQDILQKKQLTPAEERSLRFHPHNTIFLLDSMDFSDAIKKAILHHHERYDGTGYPDRLKGEAIPLLSRVIAVVDSLFAMTTDRPHRKKVPEVKALAEIRQGSGSLYDPAVVVALEKVMEKRK